MRQLYTAANNFRAKYAQQMQIREHPMGDPKQPSLENMVKNIEVLIRGFNAMSAQNNSVEQVNSIIQQLRGLGIEINP